MKKIVLMVMASLMLIALVGCSKKEANVITIGVDDNYKPMEYRNEEGELVGFDVDFASALAEEIGIEIKYEPTAWEGIFMGLETEKYDCIISSTSITQDRLDSYEMTIPYLANGQVIVAYADDNSVNTLEGLAGKVVGVQIETTADTAAEKQKDVIGLKKIEKYDTIDQTFADFKANRLDCVLVDYAVAIEYVNNSNGAYKITTAQLTNEPIGITLKKGNTELKEKFDEGIKALQKSGKLKEISIKWLGDDYTSDIDETITE